LKILDRQNLQYFSQTFFLKTKMLAFNIPSIFSSFIGSDNCVLHTNYVVLYIQSGCDSSECLAVFYQFIFLYLTLKFNMFSSEAEGRLKWVFSQIPLPNFSNSEDGKKGQCILSVILFTGAI
jgi:hypothetical protein